jgi:hypothetical protein
MMALTSMPRRQMWEDLIASGQQELPNVKSIDVIDDYIRQINMSNGTS